MCRGATGRGYHDLSRAFVMLPRAGMQLSRLHVSELSHHRGRPSWRKALAGQPLEQRVSSECLAWHLKALQQFGYFLLQKPTPVLVDLLPSRTCW